MLGGGRWAHAKPPFLGKMWSPMNSDGVIHANFLKPISMSAGTEHFSHRPRPLRTRYAVGGSGEGRE